MKHILGNSTRCGDCFYYRPKETEDECLRDGWCLNGLKINSRKVKDIYSVSENWGSGCDDWEDAEDRITHFEAMTRKVDPCRGPLEAMYFEGLLNCGTKELT